MSATPVLSPAFFQFITATHGVSALMMAGLIWFVHVVHYPLMAKVGREGFAAYQAAHVQRTGWVVMPLMLVEGAGAAALLFFAGADHRAFAALGVLLLVGIWASTFFWQVPAHNRLRDGFDAAVHQRLVRTDTVRCVLWTLRVPVAVYFMTVAG